MLALCTLGTPEAYAAIDRPALQRFLLEMHQKDGSYIMHRDGEKDIRYDPSFSFPGYRQAFILVTYYLTSHFRGVYCALVAAVLTNVLCPELVQHTAEWLRSCQTYEVGV